MAALAGQLAALAVGAGRAELLAAPATEAGGTHAGAGDGVAQGAVLALTPVAAMGAPVVAVAAYKRGAGQGWGIQWTLLGMRAGKLSPSGLPSPLPSSPTGGS